MVYNIEHPDIYDWMKNNKQYFDLFDCKRDDLKDDTNNKKLGAFKDELHGEVMIDFISHNPKVYSFNQQTIDEFEKLKIINKKVLKGVSNVVVKNEITNQDYINVFDIQKILFIEILQVLDRISMKYLL